MTGKAAASKGLPATKPKPSQSRIMQVLTLTLVAGVIAILGLLLYRFAAHSAALLAYPFEWDEDEGLAIYFARQLLRGQPIYVDINHLPMLTACYPPVYHLAIAPLVALIGPSLLAGRLVSLVAMVVAAASAAVSVRLEGARWRWGILAAALVLGSPAVVTWAPLARVDSLALMLAACGLLCVRQTRWPRAGGGVGLALLLLATFTRYQSAPLVAAALWAIWRRDRRAAIAAAGGFALAAIVVYLVLNAWSGGRFWMSTITIQATDYDCGLLLERLGWFTSRHFVLIAGLVGWIVYSFRVGRVDIWAALALTAIPLELLLGKVGAAINYHLPVVLIGAVCTALAARAVARSTAKWRAPAFCGVLLLLAVQGIAYRLEPVAVPTAQDRSAAEGLLSTAQQTSGPILTERRHMFSLMADRQPQIDMCTLYFVYARQVVIGPDGQPHLDPSRPMVWDYSELMEAVREQRYPLILLQEWSLFPRDILDGMKTQYDRRLEEVTLGSWHGPMKYLVVRRKD